MFFIVYINNQMKIETIFLDDEKICKTMWDIHELFFCLFKRIFFVRILMSFIEKCQGKVDFSIFVVCQPLS